MGPTPCAVGDRHCTVRQDAEDRTPAVWVGPNDGKWIRVVDAEEVDPLAPRPCAPFAEVDESKEVIFAAIASFRDSLCATTLKGLFERARFPERIFVGVVQQNGPEDDDCLESYCALWYSKNSKKNESTKRHEGECPFSSQIAMKRFSAAEAKGPTWARAQDRDMIPESASFCLRTDSHMAFAEGWDVKQIRQWVSARNEFAVLSTYVADASQIVEGGVEVNVNGKWEVPHLCSIVWQDGHVRNMQAKAARNLKRPKLTTLWAAGLSFAKCHAERAAPYDPKTPYVFWGEEFARTARFFTHGYDIYTPDRTIIAHDYKHTQGDPSHFKWNGKGGPRLRQNATVRSQRDASDKRIWSLLGMPGGDPTMDLGDYGLGSVRTLDQLKHFTGIELSNRTILANRCGNVDWVPWDCKAAAAAAHAAHAASSSSSGQHPQEDPLQHANLQDQDDHLDPLPPPPDDKDDDDNNTRHHGESLLLLRGQQPQKKRNPGRTRRPAPDENVDDDPHPSFLPDPEEAPPPRSLLLPAALLAALGVCCWRLRLRTLARHRKRKTRLATSKVY